MQDYLERLRAHLKDPKRRDLTGILARSNAAVNIPTVGLAIQLAALERLELLEQGIKNMAKEVSRD